MIENAIVDKNCHVGAGAQVIGDPRQIERIAGENWEMLDGIMVVAEKLPCCPTAGGEVAAAWALPPRSPTVVAGAHLLAEPLQSGTA